MGFGFFGKQVSAAEHTHGGVLLSATRRMYHIDTVGFPIVPDTTRVTVFQPVDPAQTPLLDTMSLISTTEVPYAQNDFRISHSNLINEEINGAVFSHGVYVYGPITSRRRGFYRNDVTSVGRTLREVYTRPEFVRVYGRISGGTAPANIANYTVPFFPNLHTFFWAPTVLHPAVLKGRFQENLTTFYWDTDSVLTNIETPLPTNLKNLFLQVNNNTLRNNINTILSKAQLEYCFLMDVNQSNLIEDNGTSTSSALNVSGTLILPSTRLKGFAVRALALTNITYAVSTFRYVYIKTCTSLNATTFLNIFNAWCASTEQQIFCSLDSNIAVSRSLSASDFSTATQFAIGNNRFTGSINILTPISVTRFMVGDNTTPMAVATTKHNFANVDISGMTTSTHIDLSNCQIQNLTLPSTAGAVVNLYLGGNKLDIVNDPLLWSKILAFAVNATRIYFSTGTSVDSGVEVGQNSTNGLGSNLDFSGFPNLGACLVNSCKVGGVVKLGPVMTGLYVRDNPVTGVDGTGPVTLAAIRAGLCPNFYFDWTRCTINDLVLIEQTSSTVQTVVDLRIKTGTNPWIGIVAASMPNLTTINLPTTTAKGVITVSNTVNSGGIIVSSNPLLTTLTDLDKISWSTLTHASVGRGFSVGNNSSLNMVFPIGVNNFLPTGITLFGLTSITRANLEATVNNHYTNRAKWNTTLVARAVNMGGSTPAVTGIYRAPAGFVLGSNDGTPATPKEKLYVLANNYSWAFTFNNWGTVAPTMVQTRVANILPGSSNSAVVSFTSPPTTGNLLVFALSMAQNRAVTPPAGCTLLSGPTQAVLPVNVYWKICDGTEGSTFTFNLDGVANWVVSAWEFTGFDPVTPISSLGTAFSATNVSAGNTIGASQTVRPNDLVVGVIRTNGNSTLTFTDPTFDAGKISSTAHHTTMITGTVEITGQIPWTTTTANTYTATAFRINFPY